uniref:EF-hand domain-containing protein n=1 Tax=Fundulus heteroclitus TaxID=8078 RepID=A0A3Q2U509_FUNHE
LDSVPDKWKTTSTSSLNTFNHFDKLTHVTHAAAEFFPSCLVYFFHFLHLMNNFPSEQKIRKKNILDKLFADLDQNGDLEIDFKEFIALIAMVTSACQEVITPKTYVLSAGLFEGGGAW